MGGAGRGDGSSTRQRALSFGTERQACGRQRAFPFGANRQAGDHDPDASRKMPIQLPTQIAVCVYCNTAFYAVLQFWVIGIQLATRYCVFCYWNTVYYAVFVFFFRSVGTGGLSPAALVSELPQWGGRWLGGPR